MSQELTLPRAAPASRKSVERPSRGHHAPQPPTAAQAARANAVISAFARLWPRCFFVYERRRRPLQIGIDKVLIDQLQPAIKAGRISETDLRLALCLYTRADGYLDHCSVCGNARIGHRRRRQ